MILLCIRLLYNRSVVYMMPFMIHISVTLTKPHSTFADARVERRHPELRAQLPRARDAGQRQELSDRPRQRRRLHRHAGA